MLKAGILNPGLNSLLSRVRHTNTLVIADRGFPYWPGLEIIDLALVDGIPTVRQVLQALQPVFHYGKAFMAEEFRSANTTEVVDTFANVLKPVSITFEPHVKLKGRVPAAVGLVRTGDTIQYANVILESA